MLGGNDVYREAKKHEPNFFALTRMTIIEFEKLHDVVHEKIQYCRNDKGLSEEENRSRLCRTTKLDTKNRLLLVVMWLAGYNKYSFFQILFDVSRSTISRDIHHILPILFMHYKKFVRFPSEEEIASKMEETRTIFSKYFGRFFGKTDCTHSPCYRPTVGQRHFFCGDKRKHSILSSVTTDAED